MSKENQREWPRGQERSGTERTAPVGRFVTPDVIQKSDRSLAGPLRRGTAPGVGPTGSAGVRASDFEMDRITPRNFDPMGTQDTRAPEFPASSLVSRDIRRGKK